MTSHHEALISQVPYDAREQLLAKIVTFGLSTRPDADRHVQKFENHEAKVVSNSMFSGAARSIADAPTGPLAAHLDAAVGRDPFARLELAGQLLRAAGIAIVGE